MKNQIKLILFSFLMIIIIFPVNIYSNWEYIIGPSNQTAISALEVDGNTIYIGLFEKIYKTEDLGKTWYEIKYNDSSYFINIKSIVKVNSDLFVQSAYRSSGQFYELINSKDNGKSWSKANEVYNPSFYFCLSKNNDQVFTSFYGKSTNRKYLKYNAESGDWEDIIDSIAKGKINFDPKTIYSYKNKIYFGLDKSQHYIDDKVKDTPGIYIYIPSEKSIIPIIDSTTDFWKSRVNFFIDKDTVLFIGTSTGVYKSTDEGLKWIRKSEGIHYKDEYSNFDYGVYRMMVFQNYIYAVAYIPNTYGSFNPQNTVLYFSSDDGESWQFAKNYIKEWPQDFRVMNDKIIVSTYYGLFQTDKTLESKISLLNDTLNSGSIIDFCFLDDKLYASKYKNFISVTSDNGNHWESLINNPNFQNVIITKMYLKDSLYFLTNNYSSFLVSKDFGKTYKYVKDTNGLKNTQVYSIYVDEKDIVYVGTRFGIYYSKDKGDNWEKLTPSELDFAINSIEKVDNKLFVGTTHNGIYSFNLIDKTLKQLTIPRKYPKITVNEINYIKNKLFIGTKTYPNSSEGITVNGEGILVSSDLGLTWEKRNTGLPDSCETINIVGYGDYIFAGMSNYGGVYYSTNEGLNWLPLNRGYSGYTLNRLRVFGDYLYCATSTGLYKLNLKEWINGVEEIERKNYLYSYPPYPNPATNEVSAMIYWDLALDINSADIKIYDIYGKQVADKTSTTLEEQGPYYGKLTWNCHGVNPGVYLITINYGTEKKTIKVCVVE